MRGFSVYFVISEKATWCSSQGNVHTYPQHSPIMRIKVARPALPALFSHYVLSTFFSHWSTWSVSMLVGRNTKKTISKYKERLSTNYIDAAECCMRRLVIPKAATLLTWHSFCPSSLYRLTWLGSNGRGLCGRVPPLHPSFSLWRRKIPFYAASAAAWRPMCWVYGGGVSGRAGGSFGFSGGGMTLTLQILSTMSLQVRHYLYEKHMCI